MVPMKLYKIVTASLLLRGEIRAPKFALCGDWRTHVTRWINYDSLEAYNNFIKFIIVLVFTKFQHMFLTFMTLRLLWWKKRTYYSNGTAP